MKFQNPILKFVWTDGRTIPKQYAPSTFSSWVHKRHLQESQEVSPFPTGDHKAAMNRQDP